MFLKEDLVNNRFKVFSQQEKSLNTLSEIVTEEEYKKRLFDEFSEIYFDKLVESGVTFEGKTVYLLNDLDFEDVRMSGIGAYTSDYATAFKGTFEGDYHILKNVNIFNSAKGAGAFDVTYAATLRGLGISGSVVGSSVAGGIVGYADGASVIEDCWNEAHVMAIKSNDGCAGIAGNVRSAGTVKHCYNVGTIVSPTYAAGICAWGQGGTAKIIDCYNLGDLVVADDSSTTSAIVRYSTASVSNTSNCYYIDTEAGYKARHRVVTPRHTSLVCSPYCTHLLIRIWA